MTRTRNTRSKHRANRGGSRFEPLEGRQLMAAGALDISFGTAGKAVPNLGFAVADVAVQNDGKVVMVGTSQDGLFMIARTTASGVLDPTFGDGDGLQSVTMGKYPRCTQVALQSDGKIVIGGTVDEGSVFGYANFTLVRLNPNGSLDRTFATNGKGRYAKGQQLGSTGMTELVIQSDNRIVMVAGNEDFNYLPYPSIESDFTIARATANGLVDTSFGSLQYAGGTARRGFVVTDMGGYDVANTVAVQRDGKIVVGGTRKGKFDDGYGLYEFVFARYNANGTLDRSFDGDGKRSFAPAGDRNNELASVLIQPDGKILAGGQAGNRLAVMRMNANGSADGSFGNGASIVYTKVSNRMDVFDSMFLDTRGRITVVGTIDRNFTVGYVGKRLGAVQYLANGALDSSFGAGGITTFETGLLRATGAASAPDGRVVFAGVTTGLPGGTSALFRLQQSQPTVEVYSIDASASEAGTNPASFIFTRDARYNFPTRVYYTLNGTAQSGSDFVGSSSKFQATRSVDIPAGETYAVVTVNPIDDGRLEPTETVVAKITTNPTSGNVTGGIGGTGGVKGGGSVGGGKLVLPMPVVYGPGAHASQAIEIADNDAVRVNFQLAGSALVTGNVPDVGAVFGDRGMGLTFGWDADNTGTSRDRNNSSSPDQRYDTLLHMQKNGASRKWELAVQNGWYDVRVVVGDPSNIDSVYKVNAEGKLAVSGTPSASQHWFDGTVAVNVTDGRLTISNASGAVNNRICFLEVSGRGATAQTQAHRGAAPATSSGLSRRELESLFSGKLIDQVQASL